MHKRKVILALRYVQRIFLYLALYFYLCTDMELQSSYFIKDHFQHLKVPGSKIKFACLPFCLSYATCAYNFEAAHTPIALCYLYLLGVL